MKKLWILGLTLFTLITLTGCQEEKTITFNVEDGSTITQKVGQESVDLSTITAEDYEGMNLSPFIEIGGSYDLNTPGTYSIILSVTDNYGTLGTINLTLEILELSCEEDNTQDKCTTPVSNIIFDPEKVQPSEVFIDDFVKVTWVVLPSDATNKEVTITSSDESIATVNEYGYVVGKTAGTVTITITSNDGNHQITKQIEVKEKSCDDDPLQEKCAFEILLDDSRVTSLPESNISGTDYNAVYVNNKIYYEIFVRKYADSNGDNIGDFQGIIDTLPYLKSLGVGGIWLMPMMETTSDHGYDISDYYNTNWYYGSMTKFEELLSAAELLEIDIIIDLVVNHMGAHNDIFQDVLKNGTSSDYFDWFIWVDSSDPRYDSTSGDWYKPKDRTWLRDGYYTIDSSLNDLYFFGYFSDWMPDMNLENPEVRQYMKDVATFWLNKGVHGFRLDAVTHLYANNEYIGLNNHQENIDYLTEFNTHVESVNPDAFVVVEGWTDYQTYTDYYQAGVSALNFGGYYTIRDWINGTHSSLSGTLNLIYDEIAYNSNTYIDAPFISNHDTGVARIADVTSDTGTRIAAEILLTLPGSPFIYYGEEIGMIGYRNNMVWGDYYDSLYANYEERNLEDVSEQLANEDSLLNTYIELGELRNNSLALSYGEFVPFTDDYIEGYFRVFENGEDKELVVVLINYTSTIYVPIPEEFTSYEILYATSDNNLGGISPKSTIILKLPWELKDTLIN